MALNSVFIADSRALPVFLLSVCATVCVVLAVLFVSAWVLSGFVFVLAACLESISSLF